MSTEQKIAEIAAHLDMRLTQLEVRLARHPKAARDGELVAIVNDMDDHITALREVAQPHARCYAGCAHDPGEGHSPVTGHASND